MFTKKIEHLTKDIVLKCFCCKTHEANHICLIETDGIRYTLCLCSLCVSSDGEQLIENLFFEHA